MENSIRAKDSREVVENQYFSEKITNLVQIDYTLPIDYDSF
jgi:hypothetical protein